MSVSELQARRTKRAHEEASAYMIRRAVTAGEGAGFSFWVISEGKRSINHVHQGHCSCKDYEKRGRYGVKCKHILMVEAHLGIGEELPADEEAADLEPVQFESLTPREWSLQDADEHCGSEAYRLEEERPSIETEITLGLQDEECFARHYAEMDTLWPE